MLNVLIAARKASYNSKVSSGSGSSRKNTFKRPAIVWTFKMVLKSTFLPNVRRKRLVNLYVYRTNFLILRNVADRAHKHPNLFVCVCKNVPLSYLVLRSLISVADPGILNIPSSPSAKMGGICEKRLDKARNEAFRFGKRQTSFYRLISIVSVECPEAKT